MKKCWRHWYLTLNLKTWKRIEKVKLNLNMIFKKYSFLFYMTLYVFHFKVYSVTVNTVKKYFWIDLFFAKCICFGTVQVLFGLFNTKFFFLFKWSNFRTGQAVFVLSTQSLSWINEFLFSHSRRITAATFWWGFFGFFRFLIFFLFLLFVFLFLLRLLLLLWSIS